jgi:ERCC4-type nuclease
MINDIFSNRSNKEKIKDLPVIIVDIHEKNSLIISELISSKEVKVDIKSLEIADYLIKDIAIERKTITDFVSSMINKRLFEQLKNLNVYERKLLIIEGLKNKELERISINPHAIKGMILSILTDYNIPIIFTLNEKETADYLIILSKQKEKEKTESNLHSRIPKTLNEQKIYILEAFPSIGPKTAKNLLDKFRSLSLIFNASEEELNEILKTKTKEFKDILNT